MVFGGDDPAEPAAQILLDGGATLYLLGAVLAGIAFLYASSKILHDRTRIRARRSVLLASVIYLPILYGLMVIDRVRL